MEKFGYYTLLFGVVSTILNFFDYNFKLLMWIDLWGPIVGWAIRIGLITLGVALIWINHNNEKKKYEANKNKSES